jgi:hypothetical protein
MRVGLLTCASVALLSLVSQAAKATSYGDATGDVIVPGSPFPHIDIVSVDVTNDATKLTFKINVAGDPVATDWGKYMVGIDSAPGGDPANNGWGRPIGMATGMDYWIGSWVDGGNGAENRNWNGASWGLQSATYNPNPDSLAISKDNSSVTLSLNFAGLGLGNGSTIFFDVYSSGGGGGDGAVDALGNPSPSISDWGNYYNSGSNINSYTLVVPEPASISLLALGGLAGMRRRRR